MSKRELLVGLSLLALGATGVAAQNLGVIQQRQAAMDSIAKLSIPPFRMLKGNAPFDLAAVQAALKNDQEQMAKLKGLFPDDSKTGGNTDASAKIWQARADFDAVIDKFIKTAADAAAVIKDEASFKASYGAVPQACGGCHKDADGFAPRLADSFKKLPK